MTTSQKKLPNAASETEPIDVTLARLYPQLRACALFLTQNHAAADDLVQALCEKVLERPTAFQPGTNASAWLRRVMRNLFIDQRRTQSARIMVSTADELPDDKTSQSESFSPYDLLDTDDVLAGLSQLPPQQRTVLMLAQFSGLTYRDISGQLGLPINTLGTRVFRARRRLQHVLEKTFHDRVHNLHPSIP